MDKCLKRHQLVAWLVAGHVSCINSRPLPTPDPSVSHTEKPNCSIFPIFSVTPKGRFPSACARRSTQLWREMHILPLSSSETFERLLTSQNLIYLIYKILVRNIITYCRNYTKVFTSNFFLETFTKKLRVLQSPIPDVSGRSRRDSACACF